ncbi:protein-glutamate methylesterase/protein-glutamine glutaminase [Pseudomonas sp. Marseille-Q8238]
MPRITVMIVDDSAVVRQVLSGLLAADPQIEVIGTASDPLFALEKMQRQWPDVIVLDVEMPRMDGITFLKKVMAERPTPVVICSTLTTRGTATTLQALAAGAVSIITKPTLGLRQFLHEANPELSAAIKAAARANMQRLVAQCAAPTPNPPAARQQEAAMARTTDTLVALGTSTGGTQALEYILTRLPRVCPGLVIVQHMPEHFTAAFAQRLDGLCQLEVREARHGDRVLPGLALIAPGGRHMQVARSGAQYRIEILDGPPVSRHKPSVDVLLRSVAHSAGRNALGIIMTGMGDDGARGLKAMREAGAHTLGQDEASCVVYGMPKEALKLGAVERELPLVQIPTAILNGGRAAP